MKTYLTKDHLVGFENYKYSCKDTSPLSTYVMHPFWNKVILICPKWIAPNLLTFSGFLFTLGMLGLLTIYDYEFFANTPDHSEWLPIPSWVFLSSSTFLFLAYTLDGIDGKQARRTGTSGPLGELFDHGLDSLTAAIIPIAWFSVFGRSDEKSINALRMFFVVWNVLIHFYLTHWEKYNTGLLFLPWGYDFSMWCTIITFFATGIYGNELMNFQLFGLQAGVCFEILLYVSSTLANIPMIGWNVYQSYKNKTGYMRNFAEAVRPLVPITVFFIMTTLWVLLAPFVLNKDPRVVFIIIGTIFSNICCRLIVAQMSNTRADIYNWLLTPSGIAIAVCLLVDNEAVQLTATYVWCAIALITHVHYGTFVVQEMCKHFRIKCFKIPVQEPPHSD